MSVLTSVTSAAPAFRRPLRASRSKLNSNGAIIGGCTFGQTAAMISIRVSPCLPLSASKDSCSLLVGGLDVNNRLQLAVAFVHRARPANHAGPVEPTQIDPAKLSLCDSHADH